MSLMMHRFDAVKLTLSGVEDGTQPALVDDIFTIFNRLLYGIEQHAGAKDAVENCVSEILILAVELDEVYQVYWVTRRCLLVVEEHWCER